MISTDRQGKRGHAGYCCTNMQKSLAVTSKESRYVQGTVIQVEQLSLPVVVVPAFCCILQLHVAHLHKPTENAQPSEVTAVAVDKC